MDYMEISLEQKCKYLFSMKFEIQKYKHFIYQVCKFWIHKIGYYHAYSILLGASMWI